jgi:hypothetical protein
MHHLIAGTGMAEGEEVNVQDFLKDKVPGPMSFEERSNL